MRALKFAARLGFDIDPGDYAAILAHRGEIAKSAPPRVLEELYRLLRGGAARRSLELLDVTGVLGVLSRPTWRPCSDARAITKARRGCSARSSGSMRTWRKASWHRTRSSWGCSARRSSHDALYLAAMKAATASAAVVDEIAQPILDALRVSRRDVEQPASDPHGAAPHRAFATPSWP